MTQIGYLLLFVSVYTMIWFYFSNRILKTPRTPKAIKEKKFKIALFANQDIKLEVNLGLIGMTKKTYKRWEKVVMGGMAIYELVVSRNIFASLIYLIVGKYLFRIYVTIKASKFKNQRQAQIQQLVAGVSNNLGIGQTLLDALRHAGQNLKEPLRSQIVGAVNSTKGDKLLPEAISELGEKLSANVFEKIARFVEKGLNEGQSEIGSAFADLNKQLQREERTANQRANIISNYIFWITGVFVLNVFAPFLELLIRPDIWKETINSVQWVNIVAGFVDLLLAMGLKKYTQLYTDKAGGE